MKNHLRISVLFLFAFASAAHAAVILQPLTTFGTNGDGTVRANELSFLSSSNQWQRGMAYNPTTGHLLVVDRSTNTVTSANNDVYILDGATGAALTNLDGTLLKLDNSSTLPGGNTAFILNHIGVADDGSIYVVNLSSATTPPQVHLYRWASETDAQAFVFNGDPSNGNTNAAQRRWGDTMAVRGSGTSTEILIGNRGTLAALFTPTDSSLTAFTAKTLTTDVPSGGLSIGLSFGAGNTFWGTSGAFQNGPLLHLGYDATAGTATNLQTFAPPTFPGTISPLLVIPSSNLLAGITTVPEADVVRLYDISGLPSAPVLLDRKNFSTANNNNNFSGAIALGTNGVLYALDSDNGIMAFTLADGTPSPLGPAFYLNPATQLAIAGNALTLTAAADGDAPITYQWKLNGTNIIAATNTSLTISNVQLSDAGGYSVAATNSVTNALSSTATLTVAATPPTSLIIYDPFPYAVGSLIAGQGGWFTSTSFGAVSNGSLTVPGLADSKSNMLSWGSSTVSMRLTNGVTTASGSLYFSFAYKLDPASTIPAAGASGGSIGGFVSGNTATYFAPKINIRTNSSAPGSYDMGVFKGGTEVNGAFATNVLSVGQTVFVVGRYTFEEGTTTDDTCALWVNPDSSTFGATNAPPPSAVTPNTTTTADQTQIDRFFFRQASGPSRSYADEVRVGLTWADVTPVPTIIPSLKIACASASSFTLSWPSAATGFNLEGAPSLTSPISWSPVTNNVTVMETNNNVTVTATNGNQFFRLRK